MKYVNVSLSLVSLLLTLVHQVQVGTAMFAVVFPRQKIATPTYNLSALNLNGTVNFACASQAVTTILYVMVLEFLMKIYVTAAVLQLAQHAIHSNFGLMKLVFVSA